MLALLKTIDVPGFISPDHETSWQKTDTVCMLIYTTVSLGLLVRRTSRDQCLSDETCVHVPLPMSALTTIIYLRVYHMIRRRAAYKFGGGLRERKIAPPANHMDVALA